MSGQRSGASVRVDAGSRARSARSPRHVAGIAHVARHDGPPDVAESMGLGHRRRRARPGRRGRAAALESRAPAADAGARAARPVRQAGERGSGDRAPLVDVSRPAAISWRTLCWPRRTGASSTATRDATFADRAGKEAGLALASNQSYAPAHVVLAMINYGQGRYDGALGEAQRAVSLDARNGRAWRELGRVHARLGRRDDAEKELRTAVGLAPDDWTVHNSLGSLYLSLEPVRRRGQRVRAHAGAHARQHPRLQQPRHGLLQPGPLRQGDRDVRTVVVARQKPDGLLQSRHRAVSAGPICRRRALLRRRGGTARRRVPALVQSRRRVLLGAGDAWAGQGGVRTGRRARRRGPSGNAQGSVVVDGAGLGLRGAWRC